MAIDHLNLSQQMARKIFFFFNVQYTYALSWFLVIGSANPKKAGSYPRIVIG